MGTYVVNANCTGKFTITTPHPGSLDFVIDQGGAHIRAVSTTVGQTLTIEYSEQFPENSQ
jgi:hypothetical protein